MKKINLLLIFLFVVSLGVFTSCKKKKDENDTTPKGTPNDQQGSDAADNAVDDVNDYINNKVGGGSTYKVSAYNLPCGVVSVDSTVNGNGKKVYFFKYGSQTPCGYVKKGGDISFGLVSGNAFSEVGAVYSITFTAYSVESLADGQITTVDGTLYVTNVSGGYIWQAVTISSTIVHTLRGSFDVTHSDGVVRNKKYFQRRTWASSNGWAGLTLTVAGDTLINGIKVSQLGKTHNGDYDYQMQILDDYVWSNCGTTWAGPYVLKIGKAKLDITIPYISPSYIEVEGGYYWNYSDATSTPSLVNDCTTNAYKLTTVISSSTTSSYQLY